MLIDCDTCSVQGVHCHDCVITVLLNAPPQRFELDSDEQIAFVTLADAGLVPPLRLISGGSSGVATTCGATRGASRELPHRARRRPRNAWASGRVESVSCGVVPAKWGGDVACFEAAS